MNASLADSFPIEALALPVAVIGACFGSFLNVVAWRLPREESIVSPPSHCPRCGAGLSWFENLPLIGWILLRGRCRHCHQSIACRYPLVELLTAGVWVAVLLGRPEGMGPAANPWLLLLAGLLLVSLLIPMVLIDLDNLWLPEPLCRWGVLLGLAVTALVGGLQGFAVGRDLLFTHLLATGMGLLGFEAMSALAQRLYGRPALGLGDAKLAAMMGAWLGPAGLGVAVLLAVFSGALIGGVGRLTGRIGPHQPFPFGPFLALGAATVWISGHAAWIEVLSGGALAEGVL
jgi:leader peptidase (prepilin peptidase)/N-methyltransferase